jgi:GWxTD domain-containing protein
LEEEVVALITAEERQIFMELSTKEDRKLFKEHFWARRDPDLMSPENDFREEFERRAKFADRTMRFRGIKGSSTDRGRAFVLLGPPDYSEHGYEGELAEVDESGLNPRQAREVAQADDFSNAQSDTTRAVSDLRAEHGILRMMWRYDPNPDIDLASELKIFFDSHQGFGYRYMNPVEVGQVLESVKAAYIYHPEIDYARDAQGRLMPLPPRLDPASPAKKVLREMLETKAEASDIAFEAETAAFRSTQGAYVPVFIEIQPDHLKWKRSAADVSVFGVIETADARPVIQFEEQATLTWKKDGRAIVETPVQLEPGSYTFNLGVMDLSSNKFGTQRMPVYVPSFKQDALDKSSVLLFTESRRVEEPPGTFGHAFQFGQVKFTPAGSRAFRPTDDLGILFFLYGFSLDDGGEAHLTGDYVLYRDGEEQARLPTQSLQAGSTQAVANVQIPLTTFEPGNYQVDVQITDHVANKTLSERIDFILEPEPYEVGEYTELVEKYRDGDFEEAAEAMALVRRSSLKGAIKKYRKQSTRSDELRVAALLHTESAVSTLNEVPFHLNEAREYLIHISDVTLRRHLLRQWFLAVSYFFRSSTGGWGALPLVNEALDRYPEDVEVLLAVGSVYESAGWRKINGMLDRAELTYRSALENQPENVEAHLRLGRVLQLKRDLAGAARELNWCLGHTEDRADRFVAFMLLGDVYLQLRDLPKAIGAYRNALDIDPHCQVAAVALSHALHRSGDWASSRETIARFLEGNDISSNGPDEWKRFLSGRAEQLEAVLQKMREEALQ